jgi:hypothetical protein
VIYLTLSMNAAVRALSSLLIVWLAAAASFPPCCWSMTGAHDHQAQQDVSASHFQPPEQHHHHHHGNPDPALSAETAQVMSAIPAHDCDRHSAEAVATPRASFSFVDLRAFGATSADVVVPQIAATWTERSDPAPPGGSFGSAFLSPLRI